MVAGSSVPLSHTLHSALTCVTTQKSIRHYLSQYKCFRRVYKPMMVPGKGSLWVVDFSEEWGTKSQQRRRKTTGKNRSDRDVRTK